MKVLEFHGAEAVAYYGSVSASPPSASVFGLPTRRHNFGDDLVALLALDRSAREPKLTVVAFRVKP